jgi:PAS domain S-box-containing protein
MNPNLRILIVEDSEDDMLLMLRELRRGGYIPEYMRVDTPANMQAALDRQPWDLVIADYTLPAFSAPEALNLIQSNKLDLPFIIVSGTIGEDTAVAAMKAGAHDYIIKGNLSRLIPTVERELREAQERRQRHKAEQALRESEERFRQLAENITESVFWMSDPKARQLLYVSPAYEHIWGRSCENLYANFREWLEAIHPEDRQRIESVFFEQALEGKYDEEYRIIRPDGSLRWIRDRGFPITDNTGEAYRVVGMAEDISNRKQAEEELRSSEARYRLLFESNPNPMWVFDLETLAFLAVNQAAIDHYGYSKSEFLSMTIADIRPHKDIASLHQVISNLTPEQNYLGVWKHLKKDGSVIDVEILAHTFSFANKQASLVLINDITDRLQAEQKIHEQAALIDVATDAILVRDLEHRILFWNKGAERMYGWKAAEALGKNAIELLYQPGETLPQFEAIQATLIQEGQWLGEFQNIAKNGKILVVESRWTLMRDESGNPQSILTVSTDITEKKQLEAQFLRAQRMESLGTLASGVAHDFNNLLTPILAAAQLLPLKLPKLDERDRYLFSLIEDSAKRGADLVKQILAFARGVEGKKLPLQVRHLLAEVLQVARQTFPKTIEIRTDIPATDLWTVSADATQLHQVFMNLCVNARDAMPNGGRLGLAAENQLVDEAFTRTNLDARIGSYVVVTVSDTGVGISPELLERIFDPFFTTKEVGKGTGLGLSTVLGIVKNHGGFIKVSSEVGNGTHFRVYLPAVEDTVVQQAREKSILWGNGELILIVDDEPLIQQVTQTSLEDRNYRTLVASDGIEAIALYAEHKDEISVVLMDMMMPSMDGLTALRTLHRLNPKLQAIATSGLASNNQLAEATGIGIKAFLPKPFTAKELLNTLGKVLNQENI